MTANGWIRATKTGLTLGSRSLEITPAPNQRRAKVVALAHQSRDWNFSDVIRAVKSGSDIIPHIELYDTPVDSIFEAIKSYLDADLTPVYMTHEQLKAELADHYELEHKSQLIIIDVHDCNHATMWVTGRITATAANHEIYCGFADASVDLAGAFDNINGHKCLVYTAEQI